MEKGCDICKGDIVCLKGNLSHRGIVADVFQNISNKEYFAQVIFGVVDLKATLLPTCVLEIIIESKL